MKNTKKIIALVITCALLLPIATTFFAYSADGNAEYYLQERPNYSYVTGEVKSVEPNGNGYGLRIRIAVGESSADLNVSDATFVLGEFPKTGDTIKAFYDANRPMIMIYPPQYTAVVIVNGEHENVFVDRFYSTYNDEELLSADGSRRLNVSNPETTIVSQGGQEAKEWDLNGRLLAVVYDTASRSLPPLVFAPQKIVVMYEIAVHPGPEPIDWESEAFHDIVVNGVGLPDVTFHSAGNAMFPTHVPLRAVARAFEPEMVIAWNNGTVTLNGVWGNINFRTGTSFVNRNGERINLTQEILNIDGRVHVPLAFFREVAGIRNAYSIGGTVFIDNFEPME
jgi:hypothetical protein